MTSRQIFFSVSTLAFLTTAAGAADMPVKAPRVFEQPQQVMGYVELYGGGARVKEVDTFCNPGCFTNSNTRDGWALGGAGRATW
jgi:hypothetical protein